ncbi:hypothetical protein SRHO_G00060000 [Serrasalmus rhombeus]
MLTAKRSSAQLAPECFDWICVSNLFPQNKQQPLKGIDAEKLEVFLHSLRRAHSRCVHSERQSRRSAEAVARVPAPVLSGEDAGERVRVRAHERGKVRSQVVWGLQGRRRVKA